jgi:hypothetical protein
MRTGARRAAQLVGFGMSDDSEEHLCRLAIVNPRLPHGLDEWRVNKKGFMKHTSGIKRICSYGLMGAG